MSIKAALHAYFGNDLMALTDGEVEALADWVGQGQALPVPSQLVVENGVVGLACGRTGQLLWHQERANDRNLRHTDPVHSLDAEGIWPAATDNGTVSNGHNLISSVSPQQVLHGLLDEGARINHARDIVRSRLGNDFFLLNRTQFQELVAMHLAGNDWLVDTEGHIQVVDDGDYRKVYVTTSDTQRQRARGLGKVVCATSWRITPYTSDHRARQELARMDADYRPHLYQTPVDQAKLELVKAELVPEQDTFTTDISQFSLQPSQGYALEFPVVRTYQLRVLNFNSPMVTAVRQQFEGYMPRYAKVLVHSSLPQLAIQFTMEPDPGTHLVSPKSEYNSYRVHAGDAIDRALRNQVSGEQYDRELGTANSRYNQLVDQFNGRRRAHQVDSLWVVDYSEGKL